MKIFKTLFLLLLTVGSCNNIVKNDVAVIQNKSTIVRNEYLIIQLMEDGKKTANFHFSNSDKLMKINKYLNSGELENEIHFVYKDDKIDFVFLGSNNKSKDDWLSNYYRNIEFYNDFLIKKNIMIEKPFIIANEVSDLQNLITNVEDFQKIVKKNETIYRSKKINLNIRFNPSTMERFIPQNSEINYFEYSLDNEGFLINELIKFNDGVLSIKYFYEDDRIKEINYSLKYNNGELLESTKKYNLILPG
jgi:hypothetical protein